MTACILIDEPILNDRRVTAMLERTPHADVIDIHARPPSKTDLWLSVLTALLILKSLFFGALLMRKHRHLFRPYPKAKLYRGTLAVWRNTRSAVACRHKVQGYSDLYANDLYCGVASLFAPAARSKLKYDSHEIQFHRNRKTGAMRILIELGLERMVIRRATEVHVVSHEIARLMVRIYGPIRNLHVALNNFYKENPTLAPRDDAGVALVYVGKGFAGRMLDVLDRPKTVLGADVFFYPLATALPEKISAKDWVLGPVDYEAHLLDVAQNHRSMMWCCHENACLSYYYALPNKFFQALAMGIPVIAYGDTYLARIVEQHNLGPIYDGENLAAIIDLAKGPRFKIWQDEIVTFREMIKQGEVKI